MNLRQGRRSRGQWVALVFIAMVVAVSALLGWWESLLSAGRPYGRLTAQHLRRSDENEVILTGDTDLPDGAGLLVCLTAPRTSQPKLEKAFVRDGRYAARFDSPEAGSEWRAQKELWKAEVVFVPKCRSWFEERGCECESVFSPMMAVFRVGTRGEYLAGPHVKTRAPFRYLELEVDLPLE